MEDIKDPVPMWIMAKLYREAMQKKRPVEELTLAMTLCKQAFAMMAEEEFEKTIKRLVTAKYIEFKDDIYEDDYESTSFSTFALGSSQSSKGVVKKRYIGYVITTAGAIAFRKQIIVPIEVILAEVDKIAAALADPKTNRKYEEIISSLKKGKDTALTTAAWIHDDAPLVKDFILWAKTGLQAIGVNVPF
jgi:hypothetical protein